MGTTHGIIFFSARECAVQQHIRMQWFVRTIYIIIPTTYVRTKRTKAPNGTAGSSAAVIEGIRPQWGYCIRITTVNCSRTSSIVLQSTLTACTYHGHPVDSVSLRTTRERRLSLNMGGYGGGPERRMCTRCRMLRTYSWVKLVAWGGDSLSHHWVWCHRDLMHMLIQQYTWRYNFHHYLPTPSTTILNLL